MRMTIPAAVAACTMLPAAVMAQDAANYHDKTPAAEPQTTVSDSPRLSFGLSAATDYVWRGVSQSDNHAAVFATANVAYKGFYAGAGTENVDFLGIDQEYDLWGGYVLNLGAAKVDAGFVRYGYVDSPVKIDTLEGKLALTAPVNKGSVTAAAYYTGDYFGSGNPALYAELSGNYPVTDKLGVNAAVGHQQISHLSGDYTTWNARLSYRVLPGATASVGYYDTDRARNRLSRARVVGSLAISF